MRNINQIDSDRIDELNRSLNVLKNIERPKSTKLDFDKSLKNQVRNKSKNYDDMQAEILHRHKIINNLLNKLISPLSTEQEEKNKYRKKALIVFSIYFGLVTIVVFALLFKFSCDGYSEQEANVAKFLISGLFVNLVGLIIIVFKYLFDETNSLLKDFIQLVVKTIDSNSSAED
ncbi:hypothetical protein [Streptococcus gallolyticus]|uniref:hypothetical protein n=1 Tax=Streptococcus gallolyticus TaxID=315405 RepID=UPI003D6DFFDC